MTTSGNYRVRTDVGFVVNGDLVPLVCPACESELIEAPDLSPTWFRNSHEWGCWRARAASDAYTEEELRIRNDPMGHGQRQRYKGRR